MSNLIEHQIRICTSFGALLAIIYDGEFTSLKYGFKENEPGVLEFILPPDFNKSYLAVDGIIDLYRSVNGGAFQLEGETSWFMRGIAYEKTSNGVEYIRVLAFSACELLMRRIVAYYAGSSYSEKISKPWDTMMREFIDQNYGPGSSWIGPSYGVDPDRDLEPYFTVETETTYGASYPMTKSAPWRNILTVMQEIVEDVRTSGEYASFDVVRTAAGQFEFRVFIGARGTDHSADSGTPVVVSEDRNNLLEPTLEIDWTTESNFIYGAGRGEETDRTVATAYDLARINISPFNRREFLRDCRQAELQESVQSEANSSLEENRPKRRFIGTISQTEGCIYGVHWKWGDIVTAEYKGLSLDCHVEAITVTVDNEGTEHVNGFIRSTTDV